MWTAELPGVADYYWWRKSMDHKPEPVAVWRGASGCLYLQRFGATESEPLFRDYRCTIQKPFGLFGRRLRFPR